MAIKLKNKCRVHVSHSTVRTTLINNKYKSRVARKKPLLSKRNIEKRLTFAQEYINQPNDYWKDVIFCDEVKIMLYYNDGPNKVWRKPLQALENKNLIPTIKFGKLSVMVWGCILSHGVGDLVFIDGNMNQYQYLNILKVNLMNTVN